MRLPGYSGASPSCPELPRRRGPRAAPIQAAPAPRPRPRPGPAHEHEHEHEHELRAIRRRPGPAAVATRGRPSELLPELRAVRDAEDKRIRKTYGPK